MRFHNNAKTRSILAEAMGIEPPPAFLTLLKVACQHSKAAADVPLAFDRVIGNRFGGPWLVAMGVQGAWLHGLEYQQTPPELIAFAGGGADGEHIGLIVRTPELPATDYPVGYFCPMDSDGVLGVGPTVAKAIEAAAAYSFTFESEEDGLTAIELAVLTDLAKTLGFVMPRIDHSRSLFSRLPIKPPSGYGYLPTPDRIGVMAPLAMIRRRRILLSPRALTPEIALEHARRYISEGFAGSALWILKHAYWHHWTDDTARDLLGQKMMRAYELLERPTLAKRLGRLLRER